MKIFKNRTVVGLLCIILSLVICFGLTPLFNNAVKSKINIVRVSGSISKGEVITEDLIEAVEVGGFNLPDNVIKTKEEVIGNYAMVDMRKGDYLFPSKLSSSPLAEFEYLTELDGTKQAISITISSFAAGLSGKLEAGDIVSLISVDYNNMGITEIPEELRYVKVLAATTSSGLDKEIVESKVSKEEEENELPSTITLLVNTEQSLKLADIEKKGKIHIALVYRGSETNSNKFLEEQEKVFTEEGVQNVE